MRTRQLALTCAAARARIGANLIAARSASVYNVMGRQNDRF